MVALVVIRALSRRGATAPWPFAHAHPLVVSSSSRCCSPFLHSSAVSHLLDPFPHTVSSCTVYLHLVLTCYRRRRRWVKSTFASPVSAAAFAVLPRFD